MMDPNVETSIRASSRSAEAPGAFWQELSESFRYPEFWALSSWLDILVRTRKSRLGIVWLLMPSVVYVFGMGSFFAAMMPAGGDSASFYAYVALGAMVFRSVMSTIIGSANVLTGSASFIMDGHMRLTDYFLQSIAKSFFDFCMYLPVVAVAIFLSRHSIHPAGLLATIPAFVVININALWIAVVFSLAGARFRDFGQALTNISAFIFLLTPIIWHASMLPPDSIRAKLMRLNPFYHFVEIFRAPVLGEQIETTSIYYVAIMTGGGLLVATYAYRRYARFVPLWI